MAGLGGLYWEHDGRDVPDVATLVADFDEGAQFVFTATTVSGYPVEEVIRGRFGAIKFVKGALHLIARRPDAGVAACRADWRRRSSRPRRSRCAPPANETQALWEHFLGCVRDRNRATLCPPDLGAAAVTLAAMGVGSYRSGQVLTWDKEQRRSRVGATGRGPSGGQPEAGPKSGSPACCRRSTWSWPAKRKQ